MNFSIKSILCIAFSFVLGFLTYPISFIPALADNDFSIIEGSYLGEHVMLNGEYSYAKYSGYDSVTDNGDFLFKNELKITFNDGFTDWFNYYGFSYKSNVYLKGVIEYKTGVKEKSEEFFLEKASDKTEFFSFIDNYFDFTKANEIISLTFYPLDSSSCEFSIYGIMLFNREIFDKEIFIKNKYQKIGVNLLWGGALSYLEDLDSNIQAVNFNGKIKVDFDASERYGVKSVNNNVNLINRYDTGRLVQQSYYGTASGDYECGEFMGNVWGYNPVQGGNQFNDSSKIVDVRIEENLIYIKCRPLDWAKTKDNITPSYMETRYVLDGKRLHVSCRFTDFSGYPEAVRSQELPAFYCIEPFNRFVYYGGDKPWTDDSVSVEPELIFWPDAGYPRFYSSENWSAFIGEFDDSFGIGLYTPNETEFLAGVFSRGETVKTDPSVDSPTSYIALTKNMEFRSYTPFEYDYYLTTGNVAEIRANFKEII